MVKKKAIYLFCLPLVLLFWKDHFKNRQKLKQNEKQYIHLPELFFLEMTSIKQMKTDWKWVFQTSTHHRVMRLSCKTKLVENCGMSIGTWGSGRRNPFFCLVPQAIHHETHIHVSKCTQLWPPFSFEFCIPFFCNLVL